MTSIFYKGYAIKRTSMVGVPRYHIFSVTGALMAKHVFFSVPSAKKYVDEVICADGREGQ